MGAAAEERSPYLDPVRLDGSIYARGATNGPALFTFRRSATADGTAVRVSRDYTAADGSVVARETVEYSGDQIKRFRLEELQTGAEGSVTFEKTPAGPTVVRFEYGNAGKAKKSATETRSEVVLVNDTLPIFIREHWEGLERQESFPFRYAVISRLETVAFTIRKIGVTERGTSSTVEIEMRPANWIARKLVDPIVFSIERNAPHRVLQYSGRTTPKVRHNGDWEDFDALTVFAW